jgi:uncharacterized membrane protein YbhN (UPF0104 family)
MTRARKRYFLLAALTAAALVALFFDARGAARTIVNPDWPVALCAAALTALFPFCMALRWAAILWAARRPVGLMEAAAATMAVWPLGTITPSKTGDLAKALCVKDKVPLAEGLGSVVTERALDVIVLLLFSFVGGLALGRPAIAALSGLGLACALAGWTVIALGFRLPVGKKWSEKLERFGETSRALLKRPGFLALASAGAGANWLLSIWQTQLLYRAFGVEVSFLFVCAALPIAIFVGLLPVTLAGAGTRDKALMVLFAPFASEGASLSVGILYTVCGYILPSLAGLPFMRRLIAAPEVRAKE